MPVLALTLGIGVVVAAAVYAAVRRWPAADPAAPRGSGVAEEVRRHPRLASFVRRRTDPGTATGVALTGAVVAIVAGAAVVGLLLAIVRSETGFADVDVSAAEWASQHATTGSTQALRVLTRLGGTSAVVLLGVGVALLARRPTPMRSLVAFLVLVIAGQNAVVNTVKWVVDRARPDFDPLASFSDPSFPSGHSATAAAAFAAFAAFALVLGRGRRPPTKALLAAAAAGAATMVAATRVFLGVHWVTDVLAGLALGWAWFAACSIAFGGRLLRFGAPVAAGAGVSPTQGARHSGGSNGA